MALDFAGGCKTMHMVQYILTAKKVTKYKISKTCFTAAL